jgi:hypothetical protein
VSCSLVEVIIVVEERAAIIISRGTLEMQADCLCRMFVFLQNYVTSHMTKPYVMFLIPQVVYDFCLQDLNVDVEACSVQSIDTVTSTTAPLTTGRWEPRRFVATIQL